MRTGYPPEPSGATGSGRVANFRAGAVKLPRHGAGKVALVSHLPPRGAAAIETGTEIVRPPQANACRVVPAIDPVLRRGGYEYGKFLADLLDAGIIDIADSPSSRCGIFFVHRKDAKLPLIFDPGGE